MLKLLSLPATQYEIDVIKLQRLKVSFKVDFKDTTFWITTSNFPFYLLRHWNRPRYCKCQIKFPVPFSRYQYLVFALLDMTNSTEIRTLRKPNLWPTPFSCQYGPKTFFFVEYGLLEHIFMRKRGEKIKILNFTHAEYGYFRQNHFRSFSHIVANFNDFHPRKTSGWI